MVATSGPLRIMAGQLAPVAAQAKAAAELGFSHLLLPPPWLAASPADPYLTQDFTALAPGLGVTDAYGLAKAAGETALLVDVQLDAVSAKGELAGTPFAAPDPAGLLDPRRRLRGDAAKARLETEGDLAALAHWWGSRLLAWHKGGIAGFRLLGLQTFPGASLAGLFAALREAVPGAVLLAWTPGLSREAVLSLRGRGVDGVFASLPWWDGRADWLWEEVAELAEVAPVIGLDGIPQGPTHATAAMRTPPGLAAALGQGWLHVASAHEDFAELRALNAAVAGGTALAARVPARLPTGEAGPMISLLRTDCAELRHATRATMAVVNTDPQQLLAVQGAALLPAAGGAFGLFRDAKGASLSPESLVQLAPGRTRLFTAERRVETQKSTRAAPASATRAASAPRLAIENPQPSVDAGRHPVKATAGSVVNVTADVVFDGHDKIAAALRWRAPGEDAWHEVAMRPLGNDVWTADMPLACMGLHEYVVLAWKDLWATFHDELTKKSAVGLRVTLELAEGESLVRAAQARKADPASGTVGAALGERLAALAGLDEAGRTKALLAPELAELMRAADARPFKVETPAIPVDAERALATYASWYEIFPRSMSDDPARHGTFADVERHLPRIRDMGFDVLYFPPISPIGRVNRKGRNNTLTPAPDDPGSPYAVGSPEGGHDALHPELGTLADFQHLQQAAAAHGLELAIDFAIQCSPDHPWLKQHRGWFDWRPDGSIRYAENPPKKYEDIVNVDFYAEDAVPGLWVALCDVVLFWCEQGIRIFRVDNPHTKPFPFWEWMIREVRARYPEAMFLAEAFTRPKIMYRLAKIGFSQSYTYFTWRNEKEELEEYLTELNEAPARHVFRPHFFVNTPDINPVFLQGSGRGGFLIRAALAGTLSGLFGVYCGFELCEAAAVPGREEYLDSEKYQLRAWEWSRPGNIVAEITALNRIRRRNPALQTHLGVRFLPAANDRVLFYEKATPDRSNVVLVAVSMDPHHAQEADIELPLWSWRIPDEGGLAMDDLLTGTSTVWQGRHHRVRLTPEQPYAIWRAQPAA